MTHENVDFNAWCCRCGSSKNLTNQWGHSHSVNWEGNTNRGGVGNKFGNGSLGFLVNTISWKMRIFKQREPVGDPIALRPNQVYYPTVQALSSGAKVKLVCKQMKDVHWLKNFARF